MNISSIQPSHLISPKMEVPSMEPSDRASESFGAYLNKSIGDVNQLLQSSDKKATDLATGKSENLHEAMIGFEKAETAFKLLVQVRNKAIEAYHEIMRMQV